MFASIVESSVIDSTVSVSGPLAGMFGAPTSEPLIDSQIDAEASAAPVPESPISPVAITATSDASVRHASGAPAPQVRMPAGTARSGVRGTSEPRTRSKRSLSPQSPEHPHRRPMGQRASEGTPLTGMMETVIIAEIDELKSRVATMETTIANFNKIGEQVETVQQQVFSTVKPLTDKNAELEAKVGNLESLNHNLSERMTDLQLQVNIFKSERADPNRSAQGPTSQATQPAV